MKPHKSGSPAAQLQRKKEYKARSGPVSNPGYPSPVNRKARRLEKQAAAVHYEQLIERMASDD